MEINIDDSWSVEMTAPASLFDLSPKLDVEPVAPHQTWWLMESDKTAKMYQNVCFNCVIIFSVLHSITKIHLYNVFVWIIFGHNQIIQYKKFTFMVKHKSFL